MAIFWIIVSINTFLWFFFLHSLYVCIYIFFTFSHQKFFPPNSYHNVQFDCLFQLKFADKKIYWLGQLTLFFFSVSFMFYIHISHFSLFPTAASLFSSPIFATTRSFSLPNFPLLTTAHSPGWLRGEVCAELLRPPVTSLTVNTPNHLLLLLEHTTAGCVSLEYWLLGLWTLCFIWCSPSDLCK